MNTVVAYSLLIALAIHASSALRIDPVVQHLTNSDEYPTEFIHPRIRRVIPHRLEDSQERTFHTESEELLEVHSPQGNLMTKSENGLKFNSNEFDDADISEEFFKESSEEWEEVFLNDFLQEPITSTQRTTQQPKTSSCDRQITPLRANLIGISANAQWSQDGITIAGRNASDNSTTQLDQPLGLFVDDNQTVYIAEWANHRVVEWKWNAKYGRVVAGGNGHGNGNHQLCNPRDVVVDKETDSLVICDRTNRRVVQWPRQQGSVGETIISNIDCWSLIMDHYGFIYVSDDQKHVVLRYGRGESQGTVVAGGNGAGSNLTQLNNPTNVFVDRDQTVYVSDTGNDRVTKWTKGATEASIVAGGHGRGNNATQLSAQDGIVVDQMGTVYVADTENDRIMRWSKNATEGSVVAGGNGRGEQANQLYSPIGLSFDYFGNLYVAELGNQRVQRFNLQSTFPVTYHQTYELVHVATNKSLDIVFDGTNYGLEVQLFRSHGGENQRWLIYLYMDDSIQLFNEKTQNALDASGNRTEDGSGLQVHPNNRSGAQRWHLLAVGGDVYELIGVSSGKALSVGKNGTSDNLKVQITTRDGSLAQKWRFVRHSP